MTDERPTGTFRESYPSASEMPPSVIPAEDDEGALTAAESRAKADPDSPAGPNADASGDEFTDPNAQPPA
jgi:hypothetical protein